MTSTVTDVTTTVLLSSTYETLSTTVGLAVVLALGVLLFQREVTRILGGQRAAGWAFDVALVPLLFVFVVIVASRLAELVV